jgi:hypothetical protein
VLTEITHREPQLSARRVEELYALLDLHGDDALRSAFARAVQRGTLSAAAVRRHLGVRGSDSDSVRSQATQPRGQDDGQLQLALHRAESKRGVL